jgi:D-aspartate ligase
MGQNLTETVIVMGCNTGGLAVIRSLGKRGLNIIAMTHNRSDVGTASKYVQEVVWCPDPDNEQQFVDFLLNNAHRWQHPFVIECGDAFTKTLSRHKAVLSQHYTLITPEWEVASLFLEKNKTYELANKNNVPYPWTCEPTHIDDIDKIKDEIPFPCILKPSSSHEFVKRFKTKVMILDSYETLREKLIICIDEGHPVVIQEIIPGGDSDFGRVQMLFDTQGNIVAEFYNEKIRQSPPQFGQGRVARSVPFDSEVQRLAHQLFQGVGFKGGFCSVEFRRDQRDKSLKLMEVNIRGIRTSQLIISAGIDYPWFLYQDYILDKREAIPPYKETMWIEIIPDVMNTLFREPKLLLHPIKLAKPYFAKNRVFAVFALSDIKPFLKELAELPKRVLREWQRVRNLGKLKTQPSKYKASESLPMNQRLTE